MDKKIIDGTIKPYLQSIEELLAKSASIHKANAMGIPVENEKLPYTVQEFKNGNFDTDIDNSSNILFDEDHYNLKLQKIISYYDNTIQEFHNTINEVKTMLATSALPNFAKKYKPMLEFLESSLIEFIELKDKNINILSKYIRDIANIMNRAKNLLNTVSLGYDTSDFNKNAVVGLEEELAKAEELALKTSKSIKQNLEKPLEIIHYVATQVEAEERSIAKLKNTTPPPFLR